MPSAGVRSLSAGSDHRALWACKSLQETAAGMLRASMGLRQPGRQASGLGASREDSAVGADQAELH